MLKAVRNVLGSPITGPIATGAAMAMAVALGASQASWSAREARYEERIAELNQLAERKEALLRTQLAACHAAGQARDTTVAALPGAPAPTPDRAKRLLEQQPEGIDACARMESADRAVLSNLQR